jgi:dihydrofolate reductase
MPEFLRHEADWVQFQAALDRASIVVMGRKGHEKHVNPGRKRLIATRRVNSPITEGLITFWNPLYLPFEALNLTGNIAIAGVFDLFMSKYDSFILAEVPQFLAGSPCFSKGHPREILHQTGLKNEHLIHKEENLTITCFKK